MTEFMKRSLRQGLETDGWLKSQALLIWGTDEKGRKKNLIIDGEHRHTVAGEMGFKTCPMVFLEGITEAQAKALTVKMNQKRGEFQEDQLGVLLRSIQYELGDNLALDLGIQDTHLMALLAEPEIPMNGPQAGDGGGDTTTGAGTGLPQSNVRMQQLFFNPAQHEEYTEIVRVLAKVYGTKNITDTTLAALRVAHKAASKEK